MLLHDIGHAPFSHSFEHFFGQKRKLTERLEELIKDKEFKADLDSIMQNEIDSSNIIAVLVNNKTQARIKLSYKD